MWLPIRGWRRGNLLAIGLLLALVVVAAAAGYGAWRWYGANLSTSQVVASAPERGARPAQSSHAHGEHDHAHDDHDHGDHAHDTHDEHTHDDHADDDHHDHDHGDHAHDDHGHAHGADDDHHDADDESLWLSAAGLQNVGYRPIRVELGTFTRSVTMPARVVERPGRSQIHVTSPLTGVLTRIYPIQGAAVMDGEPLFEIRLTHEELVATQRDLIRTAENLDVVEREIARLESLSEGIVPGKRLLEQQYERQRLQSSLAAERQALLLHGLDEEQVTAIVRDRKLFQAITVRVPPHDDQDESCQDEHQFHVQQIPVTLGQQVEVGQLLCALADHCELYVEGRAFEDDAARLRQTAREGWGVTAVLLGGQREPLEVRELDLLYLADHVEAESRALRFYLRLPNQVEFETSIAGHRFIEWRFKPGQRMEVRVPVERWENRIVLPLEAVIDEAAESYVYRREGERFRRVAVAVEHRDPQSAVIAAGGAISPGDVVAGRGAFQMHLALKHRAGGVDPHAGHSH